MFSLLSVLCEWPLSRQYYVHNLHKLTQKNAYFHCLNLLLLHLTVYGHIKTAQKRTVIQQYSDWYTGR